MVSVLQLRANYFAIQLNLTWSTGILLYICCYSYPSHCIQPSYRDFCEMSSHKSVCSVTCSQNIMQKFHHLKMEKLALPLNALADNFVGLIIPIKLSNNNCVSRIH